MVIMLRALRLTKRKAQSATRSGEKIPCAKDKMAMRKAQTGSAQAGQIGGAWASPDEGFYTDVFIR